jgi:hypothetical protein
MYHLQMPFFTLLYLTFVIIFLSTKQMPGNMSNKENTATKDITNAFAIAKIHFNFLVNFNSLGNQSEI